MKLICLALLFLVARVHGTSEPRPSVKGAYPWCKSSVKPVGTYREICYDSCTLYTRPCNTGERCCFNGYCRKCEANPVVPTIIPPPRPVNCRAYRYGGGGAYCRNDCFDDQGCGSLERCCYNGRCNKCELRHVGAGGGLKKCRVYYGIPVKSLLHSCVDSCKHSGECGAGETCCWNGVCRKCQPVNYGGIVPSCFGYHSNSIRHCINQCFSNSDCRRYQKCCNNGGCNICSNL